MVARLSQKLGISGKESGLAYALFFALFTSGLMSTILGSLLPDIKTAYGLDYTQSGALLSAHYAGNVCALLLAGVLPYAAGRKKSTLLLGSALIPGFIIITLTGNPAVLAAAFFFTGLSRGTWSNTGNTVIGEISTRNVAALNILHAAFAVGALACPLVIYLNTKILGVGWKSVAFVASVMGIFVCVLIARSTLSDKLTEKQGSTGREPYFKTLSFWMATGILFFYLSVEASIVGWLVSYFGDIGLLSSSVTAMTPTLLWMAILFGRLFSAFISKYIKWHWHLLAMGMLCCIFFFLMITAKSQASIILILMLLGFSVAGIAPAAISTLSRFSSAMVVGSCMGIATVGAVIMPGIVGMIADRIGLAGGIAFIGISCVIMCLLMVAEVIRDARSRKSSQT